MRVNDVIKTESGNHYTIQRAEKFGSGDIEYLLLYQVETGELAIGYIKDGVLSFINDPKQRMIVARQFDKKTGNDR